MRLSGWFTEGNNFKGCFRPDYKSGGQKGLFSIEATFSLLILWVIIAFIPHYNVSLNQAIIHKEGSDISSVILERGILGDEGKIRSLLENTNKDLNLKILDNGKEKIIKWKNPRTVIAIRRPVFSNGKMRDVTFLFGT